MKLITAVFLFVATQIAHAEPFRTQKPIVCDTTKNVVESMTGPEWREEPIWLGKDEDSKFVLLVNDSTRSWTIIQYKGDIACIIGLGDNATTVKRTNSKLIRG
jgi:hypothetical protein